MTLTENVGEYRALNGEVCLIIYRDIVKNTLLLDWYWKYEHGFDVAKEACLSVIERAKEYGCTQLISDLTKIEGTWDPINDWLVDTWFSYAKIAGIKKVVVVEPKEFFANLASEIMSEGLEMAGLRVYNVLNLKQAEECL